MEVGSPTSSAGSRRGGGDREEAARRSGGAMRARVCARVRTPQGVGALLLVGGAIVGAAVVTWWRRGGKSAKNHRHRDKGEEEEEVPDGGVLEEEQGKVDKYDENLSREDTEVEANGLGGKGTEELHEIQAKVDEIVADELDNKPADKFDANSSRESTETIDDMDHGDINKADQNSSKSGIEKEIMPNATEHVKNSDESTLTNSIPEIVHEEHNGNDDGAGEETASTQITPTPQMTAHQPQISGESKADNTIEAAMSENVSKHEEQKPTMQEPVMPVDSPACSSLPSLLKPTQKKKLANPGQNETGMKLGQDSGKGELSKGGAAQGVAMVTMNRRAASMAILAIIFAVSIGVNIVVRLYSTLQAT